MADASPIEWTDATWNPVRGCARVSEGCRNCYAERVAMRQSNPGGAYEGLVRMTTQGPKWTGAIRTVTDKLTEPFHWSKARRIFVNSMSDLFHEDVPDEFILRVFDVMRECQNGWTGKVGGARGKLLPAHTFQILTKRPARMLDFCTRLRFAQNDGRGLYLAEQLPHNGCNPMLLLRNVWLGVSVEDQAAAAERIPLLLQTPAAVRWISAEPLLGPIDLNEIDTPIPGRRLDWVVVGGESGPKARPMQREWARSIRDQCQHARLPFFFKQWGNWLPGINGQAPLRITKKAAGRMLDGREWNEYPDQSHQETA